MVARRFFPSVVVALILAIGLGAAYRVSAADVLNWVGEARFSRDTVDEDIKQVLKSALEKGGMSARFEAGVEGRVTEAFSNVPPQGVFNMVIETFKLDYSRDAGTDIVTVFRRGAERTSRPVKAAAVPAPALVPTPAPTESTDAATSRVQLAATRQPATEQDAGRENLQTNVTTGRGTFTPGTAARGAVVQGLVWRKAKFERTSFEEDIRDVFRAIARDNEMQVLFRPDVEGEVSFDFKDMDLRAAFRKLIAENSLDYSYDAESNTVTLFKATLVQRREQLIALQYITADRLRATAKRLNLRGEIIVDADNDIVLVKGAVAEVARLVDLAEKLDRQEAEKQKQIAQDRATEALELEADAKRQEALAKQRAAQFNASDRRAAAQQREQELKARAEVIDRILKTEVRVIRVRYANVGPTSQSFRGKQITIPGIDETLRALLGIGEKDSRVTGGGEKRGSLTNDVRAELGLTPPQISIDTRTNSIIVRGSKRAVDQVESLVEKLDKKLPMVEIEVIIVVASKGVSAALGIKYGSGSVFKTNTNDNFGFGADTGIADGANRTSPTDATAADAATGTTTIDPLNPVTLLPLPGAGESLANFVFRGANLALQVELAALSRDNKAQTVASPRVITLNNLSAKITNDNSVFVRTDAGANAAGALQEINGGLILDITPSVIESDVSGEESLIRLVINASNKTVDATSGNASVTGSEVQTQVEIPDGATFMLGGLVTDIRDEQKDGVPGLQDIPFIGNLFKTRRSTDALTETIFFITPKLLKSEDLYASDIAQRRYMDTQRARLHDMRHDLQVNSQLLTIQSVTLEEDE